MLQPKWHWPDLLQLKL